MPTLTIEGAGKFDIPAGKRLVNAIIDDAKGDQHYSCGGNAKCTTCRVQFLEGEPEKITQAEKDLLAGSGLDKESGVRLSCQIACEHDMSIKLIFPKPPLKSAPPRRRHPAAAGMDHQVVSRRRLRRPRREKNLVRPSAHSSEHPSS
jgi:ferredoxin